MKKREEMLRDLHRRMDEYESERRMKRAKVTKVAASVTPVCAAAVVGVGLWKGGALTPHNNQLISSTVESTASDVILSADNDSSADKHSANTKNTPIKNGEPASDNNANTNTEPQRATEAPAVQTEVLVQQTTSPVQQTEPVTQSVPAEQTAPDIGGDNMWCIFRSTLEWNGVTYNDNETVDASAYSRDRYLGKVSEFGGDHQNNCNYKVNPDDDVYTTKENVHVLIIVKANGTMIAMTNPAYLDGVVYKQHTEDVPYEDLTVYNGGFQVIY